MSNRWNKSHQKECTKTFYWRRAILWYKKKIGGWSKNSIYLANESFQIPLRKEESFGQWSCKSLWLKSLRNCISEGFKMFMIRSACLNSCYLISSRPLQISTFKWNKLLTMHVSIPCLRILSDRTPWNRSALDQVRMPAAPKVAANKWLDLSATFDAFFAEPHKCPVRLSAPLTNFPRGLLPSPILTRGRKRM